MPETSITHLLVDTGELRRLNETSAGSGRFTKVFAVVAAGIAIRIFTASAKEMALAQQLRLNQTHTGYLEPDQDVAVSDVLVRTHKEGVAVTAEGYRVIGIMDPSLVHHRKLAIERITLGQEA